LILRISFYYQFSNKIIHRKSSEVFGTPLCNFDNGIFIFYRLLTILGLVAMSLEIVVKIFLKFSSKFSTSRKTLFDAKYFRYFCPSILCYIITTIPMIQMLMVHQYYANSVQLNCTSNQTGSVFVKSMKFMHHIFLKTPESFRGIFNAVRKDARKYSIWRKRSDMGFSISSAVPIHSSCRSCCNAKEWIILSIWKKNFTSLENIWTICHMTWTVSHGSYAGNEFLKWAFQDKKKDLQRIEVVMRRPSLLSDASVQLLILLNSSVRRSVMFLTSCAMEICFKKFQLIKSF